MSTLWNAFQSTFPHGERRYPVLCRPVRKEVSIHVPARGTTVHGEDLHAALSVSIHVPARGTTCLHRRFYNLQIVSIHVPARGTTELCQFTESNTRNVSLHVPARGTTAISTKNGYKANSFQSTFPHGERHSFFFVFRFYLKSFNPRSRTGNDGADSMSLHIS